MSSLEFGRRSARAASLLPLSAFLFLPVANGEDEAPFAPPAAASGAALGYGSAGLSVIDGERVAGGADYKVFFRRGGFEFHPALGAQAPRNFPLSFQIESVGRGGALQRVASGAEPEVGSDARVIYRHGAAVVEQYDVRNDGVEQSFVFDALPAGTGDLVVRGRIATELACSMPGASAASLRFEIAGLGGIDVGAVTGIDAAGNQAAGRMRCDGDRLEFSLPAAFVDGAKLPLVLDPLITTAGAVTVGGDQKRPDVAFDLTTERWLVVWDRAFSTADVDVRGQLLAEGGTPVGPLLLIDVSTTTYAFRPVVANVNLTDRFLVAWQQGGAEQVPPTTPFLLGRSVNPTTFLVSNQASFWGNGTAPDLAGDSTLVDDDAILVFENGNAADIRAAAISVPASGPPNLHTSYLLGTTAVDREPTISKHGGSSRRFAIGWSHQATAVPLDRDIQTILFSPVSGKIGALTTIAISSIDESRPRVDGNGVNFAFVWQHAKSTADRDVALRRVTWHDASVSFSDPTFLAPSGIDEVEPDVAFAGPKYVIAWSEQVSGNDYDLYMSSLHPTTLAQAEPVTPVDPEFALGDRGASLCSQLDAGGTNDEAMIAWHSLGFGVFTPIVKIQLVEAVGQGGPIVDLGGGCGAGGTASSIGPFAVGNPSFALTLGGAAPAATSAILNLSLPGPGFACGACVFNPYFLTLSLPIAGGGVNLSLPIPVEMAYGGLTIDAQWSVLGSGVTPCPLGPGLSLSNRLRMTMGF